MLIIGGVLLTVIVFVGFFVGVGIACYDSKNKRQLGADAVFDDELCQLSSFSAGNSPDFIQK